MEWKDILASQYESDYMKELKSFLLWEQMSNKEIYPEYSRVFEAMDMCPYKDVKVVILGQDPYHGPGQAHGMSFSVQEGVAIPPSLRNIFKELQSDLGITPPNTGYLGKWAEQGVLLLNNVLTVERGMAGSHRNQGWEKFTDFIVDHLNHEKSNLAFLLWGRDAQTKGARLDRSKHLVLEAVHPSPLSAHRGFFGCKHFSKANEYLKEHGREEINWRL